MKDLHMMTGTNTAPANNNDIPDDALDLAKVLYPDDDCHELRAIEIVLMSSVGALLPRMGSLALPSCTS